MRQKHPQRDPPSGPTSICKLCAGSSYNTAADVPLLFPAPFHAPLSLLELSSAFYLTFTEFSKVAVCMDGGAGFNLTPAIVRFFYLKQATSYATTSAMALVVCDYFATLGQEVELVWFSSWSLTKIVFLLNRYITFSMAYAYILTVFFGARTSSRCFFLGAWIGWYSWIANALVQLILQIWLYAIYKRNRRFLYPVSVIAIALSSTVTAILMPFAAKTRFIISDPVCVDVLKGIQITSAFWENIDVATSTKFPPYILGITMLWRMLTVCLLGLMAVKVAHTYRHRNSEYTGLAFVLIRDSMFFCVALLCVSLVNIFMVALTPYALYQVAFGYNTVFPGVLANRILINLRAQEKCREARVDVAGVPLDQWSTMLHIN